MDDSRLLADRYRLIAPLSGSDRSVVWRAHDELLNRRVAVRLYAKEVGADPGARARLLAGATAAGLIAHPNVAAVHDCGEATGADGAVEPFVVTELVDGTTLAARMGEGDLPWRVAVEACAEAAAGLSAAHARGMVHGRVTTANVMVTLGGTKLVDFGLAGAGSATGPDDVRALGRVLYQALGGQMPDTDEARSAWLRGRLRRRSWLPADVVAVCEACLAAEPAARPTAAELASRLAAVVRLRIAVVEPKDAAAAPEVMSAAAAPELKDAAAAVELKDAAAAVETKDAVAALEPMGAAAVAPAGNASVPAGRVPPDAVTASMGAGDTSPAAGLVSVEAEGTPSETGGTAVQAESTPAKAGSAAMQADGASVETDPPGTARGTASAAATVATGAADPAVGRGDTAPPGGAPSGVDPQPVLELRLSSTDPETQPGAAPASGPAAVPASGSAAVPAGGSAAVPASGSAAVPASGSAAVPASGSAAVSANGPAAAPAGGSAAVRGGGSVAGSAGVRPVAPAGAVGATGSAPQPTPASAAPVQNAGAAMGSAAVAAARPQAAPAGTAAVPAAWPVGVQPVAAPPTGAPGAAPAAAAPMSAATTQIMPPMRQATPQPAPAVRRPQAANAAPAVSAAAAVPVAAAAAVPPAPAAPAAAVPPAPAAPAAAVPAVAAPVSGPPAGGDGAPTVEFGRVAHPAPEAQTVVLPAVVTGNEDSGGSGWQSLVDTSSEHQPPAPAGLLQGPWGPGLLAVAGVVVVLLVVVVTAGLLREEPHHVLIGPSASGIAGGASPGEPVVEPTPSDSPAGSPSPSPSRSKASPSPSKSRSASPSPSRTPSAPPTCSAGGGFGQWKYNAQAHNYQSTLSAFVANPGDKPINSWTVTITLRPAPAVQWLGGGTNGRWGQPNATTVTVQSTGAVGAKGQLTATATFASTQNPGNPITGFACRAG